jgi:hypothetical protein
MTDKTIKVVEVVETQYGEKAVIDSPYESRHYMKHLPWKPYKEEIEEHGSLQAKAESRGTNIKTSELMEVFEVLEAFDFSDDFATHASWNPDGLGDGKGAWMIDSDAVLEATELWQFAGFNTEIADAVNV